MAARAWRRTPAGPGAALRRRISRESADGAHRSSSKTSPNSPTWWRATSCSRDSRSRTVADGRAVLPLVRSWRPDLVILDLMLPGIDGFEVLRGLRGIDRRLPVIILSARGEEADKVRGFRLDADQYVTKPFGLLELLERVHASVAPSCGSADDAATESHRLRRHHGRYGLTHGDSRRRAGDALAQGVRAAPGAGAARRRRGSPHRAAARSLGLSGAGPFAHRGFARRRAATQARSRSRATRATSSPCSRPAIGSPARPPPVRTTSAHLRSPRDPPLAALRGDTIQPTRSPNPVRNPMRATQIPPMLLATAVAAALAGASPARRPADHRRRPAGHAAMAGATPARQGSGDSPGRSRARLQAGAHCRVAVRDAARHLDAFPGRGRSTSRCHRMPRCAPPSSSTASPTGHASWSSSIPGGFAVDAGPLHPRIRRPRRSTPRYLDGGLAAWKRAGLP